MSKVQVFSECVALLGDVVGSRDSRRAVVHDAILTAITATNTAVVALDPLRVTVGDELQGVYTTLGDAVSATMMLRDELLGTAELRVGLGGGELQVVDARRGIQDGSAWWNARDAIVTAKALALRPGYHTTRTALIDHRAVANPLVDPLLRLLDAHLADLREGSRRTWRDFRGGLSNRDLAAREGVSASAISQRINNTGLRPLKEVVDALTSLP
ncbi:RNA polymerase subunit sigma-70 [Arachnia propionica]|uniref:RNA polymerase subunit sigma-70 n=1 Tax=Arachnia propionica TaxID=1750 RepID=A0A3P1T4P5_9ACTN|nr:RNA polymerase subunit sigma-70 [Arachnia propionica]RRD04145.1 RNA polymerase subunit sigma-70 [Arachnia propionica]